MTRRRAVLLLAAALLLSACGGGGGDGSGDAGPDDASGADPQVAALEAELAAAQEELAAARAEIESLRNELDKVTDVAADALASAPPTATTAGTRDDPVPIGESAQVGDLWRLTVLEVDPDGTQVVLNENPNNSPPPDGSRFVLVRIEAANLADEDGFVPDARAIGSENQQFTTFGEDTRCGVIPEPLDDLRRLAPGEAGLGNVCFAIPDSEMGNIVLEIEDFRADVPVYFALAAKPG